MNSPTKEISTINNKVTPSTLCDEEEKKARLQSIKVGLKYKKVKPRRIQYDEYDDEQRDREDTIKSTFSSQQQHPQFSDNPKFVMSLAAFSAVHSGISLESATELLGSYSREDFISKSLADGRYYNHNSHSSPEKKHICTQCNEEFDEHQIVCLSYNKKCNHIYHARCMIRYLMEGHNHCPNCNEWYLER